MIRVAVYGILFSVGAGLAMSGVLAGTVIAGLTIVASVMALTSR